MHLDVQDLRNFYYRNPLGRAVQNAVGAEIRTLWPEAKGQTVAGYGFAVPFLRPYLKDSRRVIALMPAPQGVIHWPADKPNISVLCEETLWPLETGRVDKLMLVHGLETCERPGELLEECWRVLGPGDRRCSWCRTAPGCGRAATGRRSGTGGPIARASSSRS